MHSGGCRPSNSQYPQCLTICSCNRNRRSHCSTTCCTVHLSYSQTKTTAITSRSFATLPSESYERMADSRDAKQPLLHPLLETFPAEVYPLREIGTGFSVQWVEGDDAISCAAIAAEMMNESRGINLSTASSDGGSVGSCVADGEPFLVPDLPLPEGASKVRWVLTHGGPWRTVFLRSWSAANLGFNEVVTCSEHVVDCSINSVCLIKPSKSEIKTVAC